MSEQAPNREGPLSVRLDRWLFAVRVFKSRSLANQAITGGKIKINGLVGKAHRPVHIGDRIELKRDGHLYTYLVRELIDKRVPAKTAARCYELTEDAHLSPVGREQMALLRDMERQAQKGVPRPKGRPTKRDRRILEKFQDPS